MLRMEIALFLVLSFVSYVYFSAERRLTPLHRTFGTLLTVLLVHLVFDCATVYTVNHLDTIPRLVNDGLHRIFIGSMVLVVYLFYKYISILVQEETGKGRPFERPAVIFLAAAELGAALLPVHYAVTPQGNYSDGIHVMVCCYGAVAFYLLVSAWILLRSWQQLHPRKRIAIGGALAIEILVCLLQAFNPTWLISGMGMTLMTLTFYLTLENPEILRGELVEQLMRLVDFFRLSVKMDGQLVALDDELELVEAYLDLMCCRYPELTVNYDIDPELGGVLVPNFILQPVVENSLLHGLRNKGYRGSVTICARRGESPECLELLVTDTGSGFAPGVKEHVEYMLRNYDRQPPKLEGNSIGLLNVQRRIKLLCGRDCGLSYADNPEGGVIARLVLRITEEEAK